MQPVTGRVRVPGDKSVTHRALLLAACCEGTTVISGAGAGEDNLSTAAALRALGVKVSFDTADIFTVESGGIASWRSPAEPIDCGNSGTTARLLAGLLAGAGVSARLTGDASLSKRPMERVAAPLSDLGFDVKTTNGFLPLCIEPMSGEVSPAPMRAVLRIASAQVKSCLLLAALAQGRELQVVEPAVSRDHTERMFRSLGVRLISTQHYGRPLELAESERAPTVHLHAHRRPLRAQPMEIPGDSSSAAYWAVLSAITGSVVTVEGVGLNPTRAAWMDVLVRMGLRIDIRNRRVLSTGEPVADVTFAGAEEGLRATSISGAEIPLLIDEIPILSVAGAASVGRFSVHGAEELRVKESDRIDSTEALLNGLGIDVETRPDGFSFDGVGGARWGAGCALKSFGDHRLAMSSLVALLGSAAGGGGTIEDYECAAVSYPEFVSDLQGLGVQLDAGRAALKETK
jgi:3-phosphoshikimate 1-carboxyvinyltransferase